MSRRAVTVLLVVSVLVLANAGIAHGKGPESVTLTGPGIDAPVELMDAVDWPISCDNSCPPDPMVRLMEQSGLWYATGDLPVAIDEPEGDLGPRHVLTWVRGGFDGDSVEERTFHQSIYLQAEDGPVIHTPEQDGLVDWGSNVLGWFRASDDLPDTLASLGAALPGTGVTGSVAIGAPGRIGLFGAIALAVLLLIWGVRRNSASTEPERI
ncbi:MAG: hypothetical protein ACE5F5_08675 [Acidimicrobiia bacterium]